MRRREFITLLGGTAAAWPLAAHAQQRALPVIGVLSSRSPDVDTPLIAVIRRGLTETGVVEGQNVTLDYRSADGRYDQRAGSAGDLVRQQVAVIVAIGGEPSALAAKAATATIPIVFVGGGDPIRAGLVASLHRPGGNITGVSLVQSDTQPKQLEVVRKLRPDGKTTAILMNPNNPNAEIQLSEIQTAARIIGQEIKIVNARTIPQMDAGFTTLVQMRAGALIVAQDPFFFARPAQLVVLAARHALPAVYYRREFVIAGGLLSYGAKANDSYRLLGVYAARILKGEKPGD